MVYPRSRWLIAAAAGLVVGAVALTSCSRSAIDEAELREAMAPMTEQQRSDLMTLLESYDTRTGAELVRHILREQREALTIETVCVRWTRGDGELSAPVGLLPISDIRAMQEGLSLTGTLNVVNSSTHGDSGAQVRVVVVMQHQVDKPFQLAVPTSGTIICVQLDSGWTTLPDEYPKSKKFLKLVKSGDHTTSVEKDDAGGVNIWEGFIWD